MPRGIVVRTDSESAPFVRLSHYIPQRRFDDKFIQERISDAEIAKIKEWFENSQVRLYQQLKTEKPKEALHVSLKKTPGLPRSLLIYLDTRMNLRCLVQLKSHLANGVRVLKDKDKNIAQKDQLYVGKGGHRTVKFLFDLHSRELYAETINEGEDRINELCQLMEIVSPNISPLTCYAIYPNSKNNEMTITVSPYHRQVNYPHELSEAAKIRGMLQILLGVKAIHDKGRCYNDLSLSNILITDKLDFLLIDLDAVTMHCRPKPLLTVTPHYEAPEVYKVGAYVSDKTLARKVADDDSSVLNVKYPYNHQGNDIWALGIIAHSLMYGEEYFPALEFIKSPISESLDQSILIQLAHALLRPHREARPNIDEAIAVLMALVAENNLKATKREMPEQKWGYDSDEEALAPQHKVSETKDDLGSEEDFVSLCRKIFPGISNIFFQMPLNLQRAIIKKIGDKSGDFKSSFLYRAMIQRTIPLQTRFSADEIIYHLRKKPALPKSIGLYVTHVNKSEDERKYAATLKSMLNYTQSCDQQERESILSKLQEEFKDHDFSDTLLSYDVNSQPFKALFSFIMAYPKILYLNLYNYATKKTQDFKESKGDQLQRPAFKETFGEIVNASTIYHFIEILLSNFEKENLSKEVKIFLHNTAISILTEYITDILSCDQIYKLFGLIHNEQNKSLLNREEYTNLMRFSVIFLSRRINDVDSDKRKLLHPENVDLLIFILGARRLESKKIIEWVNDIASSLTPLTEKQLKTIAPEVDPKLWTEQQRKIFAVIHAISNTPSRFGVLITAEDRLVCLEHIFNALQEHHKDLYAQRHPIFDAIGKYFGRGEKITARRSAQLNVIRKQSHQCLEQMIKEVKGDESKIKQYNEYKNNDLFKFHRQNGFFSKCRNTYHQNLIQTNIDRLKLKSH